MRESYIAQQCDQMAARRKGTQKREHSEEVDCDQAPSASDAMTSNSPAMFLSLAANVVAAADMSVRACSFRPLNSLLVEEMVTCEPCTVCGADACARSGACAAGATGQSAHTMAQWLGQHRTELLLLVQPHAALVYV